MELRELIQDPAVRIDAIEAHLNGIGDEGRWLELESLGRNEQRRLFEKAAESPPLALDHFVGESAPRTEVIHQGRNTLPLPGPFRSFQKRFCRGEREDCLFGYNEGASRPVIGPGYFVAVETRGRPHWESRGAVVVDYFQVPDGEVAPGWPRVVPNSRGLQRFVFFETRDFMRRVSDHVSVGAAYKREKPLDHYFVLCRRA